MGHASEVDIAQTEFSHLEVGDEVVRRIDGETLAVLGLDYDRGFITVHLEDSDGATSSFNHSNYTDYRISPYEDPRDLVIED